MPHALTPDLPDDRELLRLARQAAQSAYVPYSRFHVGAALLLDSGRVVTGCNVENASYGLTSCAERTATTRMIATRQGDVDADARISRVAVVGLSAAPCYPCGACRQVLHEFGCEHVVVEGADGEPVAHPFSQILPCGFGSDVLGAEAASRGIVRSDIHDPRQVESDPPGTVPDDASDSST